MQRSGTKNEEVAKRKRTEFVTRLQSDKKKKERNRAATEQQQHASALDGFERTDETEQLSKP